MDPLKIELENGKYTYLMYPNGGQEALRYGQTWRDLTGDKFVYCMAARIEELELLAKPHLRKINIISSPSGDRKILEIDGSEYYAGNDIPVHVMTGLLKILGHTVTTEVITDEAMELLS